MSAYAGRVTLDDPNALKAALAEQMEWVKVNEMSSLSFDGKGTLELLKGGTRWSVLNPLVPTYPGTG